MKNRALIAAFAVALAVDGDAPPTEFRIFKRGINESRKGPVLFDDVAAESVMRVYRANGVDPIIDLQHLSIENPETSANYDPDARAYMKLQLRNGELWAVAIRWSPDGERRLREKTQRYFSPAFLWEKTDDGQARVTELLSVGLVSEPALYHCEPLIAASARRSSSRLTPRLPRSSAMMALSRPLTFDAATDQEMLPALAEALGLDSGASLADVIQAAAAWVKEMQDALNGEAEPPPPDGGDSISDDGVTDDPAAMRARLGRALLGKMAAVGQSMLARKPADKQLAAFRSMVLRETSAATTEEATNTILTWRKSHIDLADAQAKMAADRAQLEATDRRNFIGELIKLGLETPATAWAKGEDGLPKVGSPSSFYAKFSLADLRERVEAGRAAKKGGTAPPVVVGEPVVPPPENVTQVKVKLFTGKEQVIELSTGEVERSKAACKKQFGVSYTEAQLKEQLFRYATLKGNQAEKAGKKAS